LLLNEIHDLVPLDYDKSNSWRFELHPVDIRAFERARTSLLKKERPGYFRRCEVTSLDRLGFVIDRTSSGAVLTPFNELIRLSDFSCRLAIRDLVAHLFAGNLTRKAFSTSLEQTLIKHKNRSELAINAAEKFNRALKANYTKIQSAVTKQLSLKSFKSDIKGTKIQESEIRYFSRLVSAKYPEKKKKVPKKSEYVNNGAAAI
jgi:hypothetical protein